MQKFDFKNTRLGQQLSKKLAERSARKQEEKSIYQEAYNEAKTEAIRESARVKASVLVERARKKALIDAQGPGVKFKNAIGGISGFFGSVDKFVGTSHAPKHGFEKQGDFLGFGLGSIDYGMGNFGAAPTKTRKRGRQGNSVHDLPFI